MFFSEALPFVKDFITQLDLALREHSPDVGLSRKQKAFLSFCLMGILVTNSVCWARFERASLGAYGAAALSWMFRHAPIPWNLLFHVGVRVILQKYGIKGGVLIVDDSDRKRANITTRIHLAHKIHDKKTGGYFNGQNIVLLILVTPKITIPVGFSFYHPDPALKEWKRIDDQLKKQKISKKHRPTEPPRDPKYPTKEQLTLQMMKDFADFHPQIKIKASLGDNHYSTDSLMTGVQELFDCQVISSLKKSQNVRYQGEELAVSEYFKRNPPVAQKLKIRGGEELEVFFSSARLYVPSHGKKRFVVALRYTEQDEFTYVCATDMTWRTIDILETWTLRWLVEVFIEDFKIYEGWGQLAKQQGVEGSSRGLVLSLLCDLALFLHPNQEACFENKLPAFTVGSLLRKARAEALLAFLKHLLIGLSGYQKLDELGAAIERVFQLQPSTKHMSGRILGRMESSPSLHRHA